MNKILIVAVLACFMQVVVAQNNDWVYRTSYEPLAEQADSLYNFTNVYIDLNPAVLVDSSSVTLLIGSEPGASDIYFKKYIYSPSIFDNSEVIRSEESIKFFLGKYIIRESPFIIDLLIEAPIGSVE